MKNARSKKLAQVGWLLVGIGAVALLCLLFLPWSMAGAVGLADGVEIESVTVISSTVSTASEAPVVRTTEDDAFCRDFADCFRENSVRWSGFASSTLTWDHGTVYNVVMSCSDGQTVVCRVFEEKLYCGRFRYTMTTAGEARLREYVTALAES